MSLVDVSQEPRKCRWSTRVIRATNYIKIMNNRQKAQIAEWLEVIDYESVSSGDSSISDEEVHILPQENKPTCVGYPTHYSLLSSTQLLLVSVYERSHFTRRRRWIAKSPPAGDARWADVHVASSLLKAYLRRLPDPLLTAELYPAFIAADRSPERARQLRRLVRALPDAHYETLKYLVQHLRRVVALAPHNKMEARNLAIVFGPTLVRAASDDMLAMVNDMSSQCRIIESFLTHYDWYFEEEEGDPPHDPPPSAEELSPAPAPSRDLLIHNVKKIEGKDVSTRDIVSSIISAANRKIQRKPRSKTADKKWVEPDKSRAEASPGASPPRSPLTSPPAHLTTSLAEYDGLPHRYSGQHESVNKIEIETMAALRSGRNETFSIDGAGDLVSSLTSTFDQKLRTLNNSSPLDDGSIPYADECQEEPEEAKSSDSGSRSDASSRASPASPAARAHELKAAWLARDTRHSSSSSDEPERWPRRRRDDPDDSEKENCAVAPAPARERAASPPGRVLRSESLNCRAADWPGVRRREPASRSTKLKRKNGMPERGIKRRHTVGGTKDFDKDGWSARHTRTSSPDLTAGAWPQPLVPPPRPPLESHV
ncbi:rho GTPase-activating protein 23-like [Ostrinia furnacalis]|uniref:rho GTPase-activating protein 23-like n=1 Tax=Ostrinia furnacalis TaxID=93504 RepID=UPI00103D2030|nr:rho GTPase-activating protein 23-like [Ostrinia furnacalis]